MNEPRRALPQIERILLVVGDRDAGKSTTLRSMFVDPRFGTKGIVPATSQRRIRLVTLSRERCLFMRLTSPHETQQNIEHFFNRLDTARRRAGRLGFRRFNMACAMQPQAANAMPDILAVCQAMRRQVDPERIRIVVIDPRQDGLPGPQLSRLAIDGIRGSGVEVAWIDGSHSLGRHPNGLLLADFFDFT
ncbi:hypothetical protein [Caballeronia udeis]|uniref:hypothetical protein n=1 Tax=Caballeronia udeis TaxID=1232866 RepID=UPI000785A9CE|nr:hypothetical protein [Caballeronia udeis]